MTATALVLFVFAIGADQPQWGAWGTRNMVSAETGLPESFDPASGKNVKWSVPTGTRTYGTPVVARGRVLVGTNNGAPRDPRHSTGNGDRGVLFCLDERDGKLLWQLVVPKREDDSAGDWPHTGICSPPTVEGDRAYLVTNLGEVVCLDLQGQANGNDGPYKDEGRHMARPGAEPLEVTPLDADIIWIFDPRSALGVHQHDAAHGSVLLSGEFLYVCTSNGVAPTHRAMPTPEAPSVVALEKATGRLVATDAERIGTRMVHCTWSSPSSGDVAGRSLVFFGGGDGWCYAFEALQGSPPEKPVALKTAWRFDCDPAGPKKDIYSFQGNKKESPSNITGMPVFDRGRVYVAAGGDYWHGKLEAWLKCIDASGSGDVTKSHEKWSYPLKRHVMATPSVAGDLVFIADCGRMVHCIDRESGRAVWIHETKGDIWASTLVADGKLYIGTQRGDFWMLGASRELKVLGQVELESELDSSPVAANGTLYVATMSRLFALERK